MKAIITALALATSLSAITANPAAAQGWSGGGYEIVRDHRGSGRWDRQGILPERRIARIVYREGFAEIEEILFRRGHYVVHAVRPNGAVFRLALDAYDGSLIDRERIGWSRGYDRRNYGAPRHGIEFRFGLGG